VINVVDVSQDPAIDQMSGIVHSLHSILGQAHLDEPADELGAVEHPAIHSNAPPATIQYIFSK